MKKYVILVGALGLIGFFGCGRGPDSQNIVFPGLQGPSRTTRIEVKKITSWQSFSQGGQNAAAILLTDEDSSWLGLAQGLKAFGIPFMITRDYREAIRHPLLLVYPRISGKVLAKDALEALIHYPQQGGTLIGFSVLGGGLAQTFGFHGVTEVRKSDTLYWKQPDLGTGELIDLKGLPIHLGSFKNLNDMLGGEIYLNPANLPVAAYADGQAAMTQNKVGKGRAYAVGLDWGFFALKGYNNREEHISRTYVNDYEPTLDTFFRFVKALYRQSGSGEVTLGSVPDNKALTVILSHDIDFGRSMRNAVDYARYERSKRIKGTYFIQVKYIKDYYDDIFFNLQSVDDFKQIQAMGMEVASHSVAHSRQFNRLPLGTGQEQYPSYQPFIANATTTEGATLLGELRVSKFLLEHFLGPETVISFRPGHLSNPYALPQALQATGYRYSSSVTANNSLTHLPFQLNYNREQDAALPVYEFPVTIEDEAAPRMDQRIDSALALAGKISRYGGLMMVLIHPNVVDYKLKFEQELVTALADKAWFSDLRDFGDWWAARDQVRLNVRMGHHQAFLTLDASQPIAGLTLQLPAHWRLESSQPALQCKMEQHNLILPKVHGQVTLMFSS